jgi:Holliday junction resolvase
MFPKPAIKESAFWQSVKAGLSAPDVQLCRIENESGTGVSDVLATRGGHVRFIELKMFHGQRLHFRNSQRSWILRHTEVGGTVFVLARKDDEVFLYDGASVVSTSAYKQGSDQKSFSILQNDLPAPLLASRKPFAWNALREAIFA